MAAVVHDQVLHTLALIQRNAGDTDQRGAAGPRPGAHPAQLALQADRVADRALRRRAGAGRRRGRGHVRRSASRRSWSATRSNDERVAALVAATREALVNAARHAKVGTVSLYAEAEEEKLSVFVRDRGAGLRSVHCGRRSARRTRVDHRPDAPPRRPGRDPVDARARAPRWQLTMPRSREGIAAMTRSRRVTDDRATRPLRVFLVDDHAMFRAGVRAELGALRRGGRRGGHGRRGDQPRSPRMQPDVVLLDVHMPDGGGRAVLEALRRSQPEVKFLALSVSDAAEDVIGLIRAGARGYVTKTISPEQLADAVRRVADGDAVFSPRLAGFVLDAFAARPDVPVADPELDQLTNREREVLRLLARGYAYKEIAKELYISIKTVETHVSNVLRKLQMSNRYELSRWAADRRLV